MRDRSHPSRSPGASAVVAGSGDRPGCGGRRASASRPQPRSHSCCFSWRPGAAAIPFLPPRRSCGNRSRLPRRPSCRTNGPCWQSCPRSRCRRGSGRLRRRSSSRVRKAGWRRRPPRPCDRQCRHHLRSRPRPRSDLPPPRPPLGPPARARSPLLRAPGLPRTGRCRSSRSRSRAGSSGVRRRARARSTMAPRWRASRACSTLAARGGGSGTSGTRAEARDHRSRSRSGWRSGAPGPTSGSQARASGA